jgi:hypothetical protein
MGEAQAGERECSAYLPGVALFPYPFDELLQKDVTIMVTDATGATVRTFTLVSSFPKSWKLVGLDSSSSSSEVQ